MCCPPIQQGAYSIKFSGADGDGDPLFCVELVRASGAPCVSHPLTTDVHRVVTPHWQAFKIVPAPHHGLAAAAQELLGALGSRGARKGAADALRAAWRTEQPSGTAAAAVATA